MTRWPWCAQYSTNPTTPHASYTYSPGWRRFSIVVVLALVRTGLRWSWRGQEHVPRTGGVIIAANHLSEADPFAVAHYVYEAGRYPVFLGKEAVIRARIVGTMLRGMGHIPVARGGEDAILALRAAVAGIEAGECLVFYPEGTCTRDPELWPMTGRTGAARLALTTGAPIVPLAHWGAQDLLRYPTSRFRPLPRKLMLVTAGPPVDLSAYAGKALTADILKAATDDIMRSIAELLGELRGQAPPREL
ncbi:MAG: lysophospholipid acyltransferase family protein [Streptosporangiaceae bacterium]